MGTSTVAKPRLETPPAGEQAAPGSRPAYFAGAWHETQVFEISGLQPGQSIEGPGVVEFPEATCVVRPGWTSTLDLAGALVLERL